MNIEDSRTFIQDMVNDAYSEGFSHGYAAAQVIINMLCEDAAKVPPKGKLVFQYNQESCKKALEMAHEKALELYGAPPTVEVSNLVMAGNETMQ